MRSVVIGHEVQPLPVLGNVRESNIEESLTRYDRRLMQQRRRKETERVGGQTRRSAVMTTWPYLGLFELRYAEGSFAFIVGTTKIIGGVAGYARPQQCLVATTFHSL